MLAFLSSAVAAYPRLFQTNLEESRASVHLILVECSTAEYRDLGATYLGERHKSDLIKRTVRRFSQFGYQVTIEPLQANTTLPAYQRCHFQVSSLMKGSPNNTMTDTNKAPNSLKSLLDKKQWVGGKLPQLSRTSE